MTDPNAPHLRTLAINTGGDFSPVIASSVPRDVLFTKHLTKYGVFLGGFNPNPKRGRKCPHH